VTATPTSAELFAGETGDPYVIALRASIWSHAPLLAARLREQMTKPDDPFAARPPTSPGAPLNNLGHQRRLSDSGMAGVAPNVDTLYSVAWIDLAEEPFVLEAPAFGSRYYTFQLGLADTATELSLGARTHGSRLPAIVVTGPGERAPVPADMLRVASTTRYLLIAGRILVRPDDPDDVAAVYDLQSRIRLRPLSRQLAGEEGPNRAPDQRRLAEGADGVAKELAILVELGNLLRDWVVDPSERGLIDSFETIGVSRDRGFDAASLDDAAAAGAARGLAEGRTLVERKTYDLGRHANGWTINYGGPRFGDDYLLRAAIAEDLVYVTVPEEALYPVAKVDADGEQLTGTNGYRLVFAPGVLPPVDAFWSVTMYRRDAYPLVANPLNRYSIGDRTPSLVFGADGSLTISIGREPPAGDSRTNWLPAPEGPFYLMMRLYVPRPEVLDGSWVPPPVERLRSAPPSDSISTA
jgi:hypothetical protein